MPENPKKIKPSDGFIHGLSLQFKLFLRLMGDNRVNPFLKLIPFASLLYFLNPFDIPTPLDDFAIIGLGIYMFIELCPPDIVDEHMKRLRNIELDPEISQDEDVIDVEFHEEDGTD